MLYDPNFCSQRARQHKVHTKSRGVWLQAHADKIGRDVIDGKSHRVYHPSQTSLEANLWIERSDGRR